MNPDPITMQLIANSLLYASEEMGLALRNSAYSPNIKERMDHSAAIFDTRGRLLAQAEHIPVHLGSLPWGLVNLIERCSREGIDFEAGSMVLANDPYVTGTHLNDVTVAAPVHHKGELIAFAVNKAHHSDVGGRVPGSISMESETLSDEGVVIEPSYLWRGRRFVDSTVEKLASASRSPAERRGDLKAQLAANITGMRRVKDLVAKHGVESFELAAAHSIGHSESLMKRRISRFRRGTYRASDYLEGPDGSDLVLKVRVTISRSHVDVDYTGTDKQVEYPLNAVFGVTISGAYYVLRTLTGSDIPANHGAFAPIAVTAPRGTLLNPTYPHPVAGGNVETSQRNADLVYKALAKAAPDDVPAASGGSMNNVMVGGKWKGSGWAFYETIGVGLGGSRIRDGLDGIQSNMTNTMNTPIEEVERSLPMMVTRYEFRPDSSGPGTKRGGCGLIRAYRIVSNQTTFTIVADRERHFPWGLNGGGLGGGTEVRHLRGGVWTRIPSKCTVSLEAGDEIEVRTAGGGGFGSPSIRRKSDVRRDVENGFLTPGRAARDYR
ncbi:MAG: hydantoinase B/oxoprolinase family protein [Thaumarchaeota archaeon]|nr:hydantoinase B/oxoprolinase family protein [Nitrososphaerota archaeon]